MSGSSQPDSPAVWLSTWRVATASLPPAANSGQYVAIGSYRSSSPRSARIRQHSAAIVFVVDQTLMIVSSCQSPSTPGTPASSSSGPSKVAVPPHRSTTNSPSTVIATDAPTSPWVSKLSSNAVRTASKPGATVPWISAIAAT